MSDTIFVSATRLVAFVLSTCCMATAQSQLPFTPLQFSVPSSQLNANALATEPSIRALFTTPTSAALAPAVSIDVRGDGRPDVFACSTIVPPSTPSNVPCRFLRPQPDGTLVDVTRQLLGNGPLPSMVHPREIVKGDFNRDGRLDIFVAGHGYDAPPFPGEKNVLLLSNGDGTYTDKSSNLPGLSDFSHSACTGDINGDGFLDIYVGNVGGTESPYFLMGGVGGTFTLSRAGLPFGIVTRGSTACQLADLDGDGHVDLVLGAFEPFSLQDTMVLWNDGTGDFQRNAPLELPKGPLGTSNTIVMDILAFDIDHDGKKDLLILSTQNSPSYVGMGVQAFINKGNRMLEDQSLQRLPAGMTRKTGDWCSVLQTADFDGDGWEDLYCEGMGIDRTEVRIWRGAGNGVYEALPVSALPASLNDMTFLIAVDFDGDGRTDLARLGLVGPQFPDVAYRSLLNRTGGIAGAFLATPSAGPNGTISPPGARLVAAGLMTTFTVTPDTGYTASVGGSCGGNLVGTTYTTNAITADCTVEAAFAVVAAPTLAAVVSRKTHGAAGPFDLLTAPAPLPTDPVTAEPRTIGSGHLIVFQFDSPITIAGTVAAIDAVTMTTIANVTSVASGNDVTVTIPVVADNRRVRITIDGVNGIVAPLSTGIGFLVGDVNNTRSVSASDISGVKARSGQPTTTANFKFDVNLSGAVNSSDISAVKARSGLVLP